VAPTTFGAEFRFPLVLWLKLLQPGAQTYSSATCVGSDSQTGRPERLPGVAVTPNTARIKDVAH